MRGLPLVCLVWWAVACGARSTPREATSAARDAGADAARELAQIARAEDMRRAADLPRAATSSADPTVRRAAARAEARVLDPDDAPLLHALEDEDPEVVAWAAFGLGERCAGREDLHVRALAARLTSLDFAPPVATERTSGAGGVPSPAARPDAGARLADETLGPRVRAIALRAIGRCGGKLAEAELVPWLREGGDVAEAAAYALGDIASTNEGCLAAGTVTALLDAAQGVSATSHGPAAQGPPAHGPPAFPGAIPLDAALAPFSRGEGDFAPDIAVRLAEAAHAALARQGSARLFAVRALGRSGGKGAVEDLVHLWSAADAPLAERVEAAKALGRHRPEGPLALAEAMQPGLPMPIDAADGETVAAWTAAIGALGSNPPPAATRVLWGIVGSDVRSAAPPAALRRASDLRCAAALSLARGAWDSEVLRTCDVGDGTAGDRARLAALDRAPLTRARRAAWAELAGSPKARVREAAIRMVGGHPELADAGRAAIARALDDARAGVVTAAADVVRQHPDRVMGVAARDRKAALDPAAPAPKGFAAQEVDPGVARALQGALARRWAPVAIETRAALLDAAVAAGITDAARSAATAACADPNATLRERGAKALAALGDSAAACLGPPPFEPAPELELRPVGVRLAFDTDAGPLAILLDPTFAPVAVARIAGLARAGFYDGLSFHRVVPGFVAQFGDPEGDGFGGGPSLLRCQTSPLPFGALDVGVALAGRDTGSSQLFVTLARYPRLDGQYAWVGRAEGDWTSVVEGDVIRAVHVEP